MLKTAWMAIGAASKTTTVCAAVAAVTVPGAAPVIGAYISTAFNGGVEGVEFAANVLSSGAEFVGNAIA